MKTWNAKTEDWPRGGVASDGPRRWWLVDASDQTLGRLAARVAPILRGKHRPTFTPHVDTGDFVVIVHAKKVRLTGQKLQQKKYYRRSRYIGSLKEASAEKMQATHPEELVVQAIRGMLPKNRLSRQVLGKLKVYAGAEHPHTAQKPEALRLDQGLEQGKRSPQ